MFRLNNALTWVRPEAESFRTPSYSNDVYDCFDNPELAKEVSLQPFKLIDLTVMDDEQIQQHGLAALFQMLIKHHADKSIYRLLKTLIRPPAKRFIKHGGLPDSCGILKSCL